MSLQAHRYQKKQSRKTITLHARNQQIHTRNRFRRHHGINLSQNEYFFLICQIQSRRSIFIQAITNRLKNHIVELRGELFLIGYDKKTKQIATVLPSERLLEVTAV